MNSWPKGVPPLVSGIMPWYRWRSEPQIAAKVTRTMASFGCSIWGMSFSRVRTLYGPRYSMARNVHLLPTVCPTTADPNQRVDRRPWGLGGRVQDPTDH